MTIPRNDELKKALVSRLKSNANVLAELSSDSTKIKEWQWQGDEFLYPCVRVRILTDMGNVPDPNGCNKTTVKYGIMAFSEEASSQQADRISGIIANELHTQSFTSEGIRFASLRVETIIPAIRMDERTWVSEVVISGTASG